MNKSQGFNYEIKFAITKTNPMSYSKILNTKRAYKRSALKITEQKNSVEIMIKAKDITALKATTNSLLNELLLIEQISKLN